MSLKIAKEWLEDMPQQFLDKPNIEVFVKAFSKQMEEVFLMYDQLEELTSLEKAQGINLDHLGNILNMTRKDAAIVLRKEDIEDITDDLYRQVLMYKTKISSSKCTYYDIMEAMSMIWDTSKINYVETPLEPAKIHLDFPEIGVDGVDPAIKRVLSIKAAGVQVLYMSAFNIIFDTGLIERFLYGETANLKLGLKIPMLFYGSLFKYFFNGEYNFDGEITWGSEIIELVPVRINGEVV